MLHRKIQALNLTRSGVGAQGDPFLLGTFKPLPGALAAASTIGTAVALGAGKLVLGGVLAGLAVVNAVLAKPDFAWGEE